MRYANDAMSSEKLNETNRKIIEEHFQRNFNRLVKKLAFRAGTTWDAEDAIMDAYERAIRYCETYDEEKNPIDLWMSRIISNAIKDYVYKNKGRADIDEFDEEAVEGIPCDRYATKIVEEIRHSIAEQKPETAEILSLFFEKGYTANDISHLVSHTRLAIHQKIYRFREQLREKYQNGGSLQA